MVKFVGIEVSGRLFFVYFRFFIFFKIGFLGLGGKWFVYCYLWGFVEKNYFFSGSEKFGR